MNDSTENAAEVARLAEWVASERLISFCNTQRDIARDSHRATMHTGQGVNRQGR